MIHPIYDPLILYIILRDTFSHSYINYEILRSTIAISIYQIYINFACIYTNPNSSEQGREELYFKK